MKKSKSTTPKDSNPWKRLEILNPVELMVGQKRKKKYKISPEDIEAFKL
jgi:hypothetical protein